MGWGPIKLMAWLGVAEERQSKDFLIRSMNALIFIPILLGCVVVVGGVLMWSFLPHRRRLMRFKDRQELSLGGDL